jgi:methyltransferase family protein
VKRTAALLLVPGACPSQPGPLAGSYERGRSGWPRAAIELADLPSTATVVDLGAGTGKLTRLLVLAFARVVAVEPADALRRLLVKSSPAAGVVAGAGRRSRSPNGTIDAVFAAEAVEQLLKKRIPQGNRGYDPLDLAGAHYTEDDWRHMFGAPFEPVRKARLRNLQIIERNGLVAFFASMGWLADCPTPNDRCLPLTSTGVRGKTHVYWTRLASKRV